MVQQSLDALSIRHRTSSFQHVLKSSLMLLTLIDSSPVFQAFYLRISIRNGLIHLGLRSPLYLKNHRAHDFYEASQLS
jgi:hypothetical protein